MCIGSFYELFTCSISVKCVYLVRSAGAGDGELYSCKVHILYTTLVLSTLWQEKTDIDDDHVHVHNV